MSQFPRFRRIFRIHRPEDAAKVVDEELRFHFEMTVKELLAEGMDAAAARAEAERRFGDIEATREGLTSLDRARTVRKRRGEWWRGLGQDLRYAARGLRLRPGFAAAVTLTLGSASGPMPRCLALWIDCFSVHPPIWRVPPTCISHISPAPLTASSGFS